MSATAPLRASDDRNLADRTYREDLAREVMGRVPAHAAVLGRWHAGMQARLGAKRGTDDV